MIPRVTATIDLAAIRQNLAAVRHAAPGARVMAAIKADGYGHGAVHVARALEEAADCFAVACLEEALVLREARILGPIALLEGVLSIEEAKLSLRHDLQVVINDHWQLELLETLPRGARVSLWIKCDSGMHRLGFPLTDVAALWRRVQARPEWDFRGWMTHLACADEPGNPATREQVGAFNTALGKLPGARSIANSAGLLAWPEARADWVRPGLMLYGASPLPDRSAAALGLKPAMRLESRLIAVRDYEEGAAIGYGLAYRCPDAHARRGGGGRICRRLPPQPADRNAGRGEGAARAAGRPRLDGHDHGGPARRAGRGGRRCRAALGRRLTRGRYRGACRDRGV
jgi:alanine racemase